MRHFKLLIFCILYLITFALNGQISDDFSDDNFSENPKWEGDTSQFFINAFQQLQLNGNETGRAQLRLPVHNAPLEREWDFYVKLSLSPSANNYARIYLISNESNLFKDSLQGYYLQLGEAGGNDVMELFYKDSSTQYSIFRGRTSIANGVAHYIKVVRDSAGLWTLALASNPDAIFMEDASGALPDTVVPFWENDLQYFGIQCVYTSGNKTKFLFDDFYIGPVVHDTTPPRLVSTFTDYAARHLLRVCFSEPMSVAAIDPQHYSIQENDSHPVSCVFTDEEQRNVLLEFSNDFVDRHPYHLVIEEVSDMSGNPIFPSVSLFTFYKLKRNDIIISEIMADPSPSVGLPESEYLELHNRLPFDVVLENWRFRFGTVERTLPLIEIPAEGYAIVTSITTIDLWDGFPNVHSISAFNLTDDGQKITLLSDEGEAIHYVNFKKTWHTNQIKRDGGWALEMADLQNPCAGEENWDSSVAASGGTPGTQNSILESRPDVSLPEMLKVTVPSARQVKVHFSEPIVLPANTTSALFHFDPNVTVVDCTEQPPDHKTLLITLLEPLEPQTIYTITIGDTLCDCVGNAAIVGTSATFGLPEQVTAGDIVINEVLSNPFGETDADFVELYNRSEKIIDLGQMLIGSGNGENPDNATIAVPDGFLIFPDTYAAICKNRKLTLSQYLCPQPSFLQENEKLPAFANDAGTVHLLDSHLEHIDRFAYEKGMHYSMLQSTDGVSLERIHFDGVTQDATNWTSAAEGYGWATPGYRNSQWSDASAGDVAVSIQPDIFSPDGDGYDDFTEIFCSFLQGGFRVTVDIFDKDGHLIKRLANNRICGTEERFIWDGASDDGRVALNGFYVVNIQLWHPSGKTKMIRKSLFLTRR